MIVRDDMTERPKYGPYDIPGRPTDADFDEMWAYIRAVHGGTCDGHWYYEPPVDTWILIHGYSYSSGPSRSSSGPNHRGYLQSAILVHQRFFVACRERQMTITQGLEHVQLADKIREHLLRAPRLIISDLDHPIAIEQPKN